MTRLTDLPTEPCPVCGLRYVATAHIPENPDPDHSPDTTGTEFVHEWRAATDKRGHATVAGCIDWHNSVETDTWSKLVPDDETEAHR